MTFMTKKLRKHCLSISKSAAFPLKDILVCSPYYGMGIMAAWGLGYRGEGVTIGVVDTGVEVSHIDLAPNIVSDRQNSCKRLFLTLLTKKIIDLMPSIGKIRIS